MVIFHLMEQLLLEQILMKEMFYIYETYIPYISLWESHNMGLHLVFTLWLSNHNPFIYFFLCFSSLENNHYGTVIYMSWASGWVIGLNNVTEIFVAVDYLLSKVPWRDS